MSDLKQIDTKIVTRSYKNARITIRIGCWSDGTFTVAEIKYFLDDSNIGTTYAPTDARRICSTEAEAVDAALIWARTQIDPLDKRAKPEPKRESRER